MDWIGFEHKPLFPRSASQPLIEGKLSSEVFAGLRRSFFETVLVLGFFSFSRTLSRLRRMMNNFRKQNSSRRQGTSIDSASSCESREAKRCLANILPAFLNRKAQALDNSLDANAPLKCASLNKLNKSTSTVSFLGRPGLTSRVLQEAKVVKRERRLVQTRYPLNSPFSSSTCFPSV